MATPSAFQLYASRRAPEGEHNKGLKTPPSSTPSTPPVSKKGVGRGGKPGDPLDLWITPEKGKPSKEENI